MSDSDVPSRAGLALTGSLNWRVSVPATIPGGAALAVAAPAAPPPWGVPPPVGPPAAGGEDAHGGQGRPAAQRYPPAEPSGARSNGEPIATRHDDHPRLRRTKGW